MKVLYPDFYKPMDSIDWVSRSVISAFEWSIYSVSWSPDGHTLAFAAQIDGDSSDVYLYNLETGSIQHLENTVQSVFNVNWSPDGEFIVFENSMPGYIYDGEALYVVKPGNQVVDNLQPLYSQTWLYVGEWLSPDFLLIADGTDTAGNFVLQILNITTGQLKVLWPDAFGSYAVDTESRTILLNTSEFADPETMGLYFVSFDGKQQKIFNGLYYLENFFRGGAKHRFLINGVGGDETKDQYIIHGDVVGLDLNGTPMALGKFEYNKIVISPDNTWLLMYDKEKLYLYDTNDDLIKTYSIDGIRNIVWRPDSRAIFYSDGKGLYTLDIPGGIPKLIDECRLSSCSLKDVVWLP